MLSCQRCKQTTNGPQAFLLTCRGCGKTWHHRCHMPPIEDEELIRRIRATNAGDTDNGLATWTCRRCKKGVSQTSGVVSTTESREDSRTITSTIAAVKQESAGVQLIDQRSERPESIGATPVKRDLIAKKASASQSHVRPHSGPSQPVDADVQMTDIAPTAVSRVSTESREHGVGHAISPITTSTTAVKQNSVDVPPNDRLSKGSKRPESTEATPVKRNVIAKRTRPSSETQTHVQPPPGSPRSIDSDVQMADVTPVAVAPPEKQKCPEGSAPSYRAKCARKYPDTVLATSSEDDAQMDDDVFSEPTLRTISRPPSSAKQANMTKSVTEMSLQGRAASSATERERVRPPDGTVISPGAHPAITDEDDDPDDLYGPPVERRIVRILPSLAEELKEQRRRTAVEKDKLRTPLAPDWISARHVHDPLWTLVPTEVRKKRQKPTARKLGDNGLDVDELMDCFTIQNWLQEHKN